MASSHHLPNPRPPTLLYNLLLIIFFLSSTAATGAANITGFSFKLIHRDAVLSPPFPGNLTSTQLHNLHLRNQSLPSSSGTGLRPPARYEKFQFVVEVSIGTPAKRLNLLFDTGSSIFWTQCFPCKTCFNQDEPHYRPSDSSTYRKLSCRDRRCKNLAHSQCTTDPCDFNIGYEDESSAKGEMSIETFTFDSRNGVPVPVPDIVFGCTRESRGPKGCDGTRGSMFLGTSIGGIFAMSPQPASFISQISPTPAGRRFSYCLPLDSKGHSYVSFGDDIVVPGNAQTISILPVKDSMFYYLDVIGISVGSDHLNIPKSVFALNAGGMVIDSGTSITRLVPGAYNPLVDKLNHKFAEMKYSRASGYIYPNCYEKKIEPRDPFPLPPITFHFRGGRNLVIPPRNSYRAYEEESNRVICLTFIEGKTMSVIGAMQQRNVRFIYDLGRNTLSFADEECAKG